VTHAKLNIRERFPAPLRILGNIPAHAQLKVAATNLLELNWQCGCMKSIREFIASNREATKSLGKDTRSMQCA
jgi:hypothetical protein